MRKRALFCLLTLLLAVPALAADFPPSSLPTIPGIDVSVYNGAIDFASVRADGVELVVIRSSLGFSYVDPNLERNADGARNAGLPFGFYHFCTASTEAEAISQANFFLRTIKPYDPALRLVLELDPGRDLSRDAFNNVALAFLERVEKLTERVPAIYCSASTARDLYDDRAARYPLWVADYGPDNPEPNGHWDSWIGFQYTSTGRVDGVRGHVDRDRFTREMFASPTISPTVSPTASPTISPTASPTATPTISPTVSPTISPTASPTPCCLPGAPYAYVVQRGDTLTVVAARFDTTVAELVRLNDLPNPNAIYTGQILRYK